jgi:SAM-dependent methyltransferase
MVSSAISGDIGERVRDFYDQHPYPPPVESLERYHQRWQDPRRRRADFHLIWPWRPYREDHSILIAGCGTSQAAKHGLRWPASRITAIDCSATSIRHTERLKKQHGLRNLQLYQLAIERVGELGMNFDQIVCTGVLHHLEDPDRGLRALGDVLKPDGVMQLMVYAPYGRTGIYMLQEFCRRIGAQASDKGIRDLIRALGELPPGHPLQSLLHQVPELCNEAAIADALLHPHDHAYAVPQLFELIERAGLTFGRWLRQAPYSVQCGVFTKIPQAEEIAKLPLREQYAVSELFRGTMIRHSAIVYPKDSAGILNSVNFAGDHFLDYVPVCMSDTLCIQDRVPPGLAVVLLNRTHTYRDLYLPISATEKKLFDAIDGCRTIADIVEGRLPSKNCDVYLNGTRDFFERLWWHDQVVFDTHDHRSPERV